MTTITWIGRFITDTCLKSVMGKAKGPYKAEYPAGSSVMIASLDELEKFFKEWKYHNPLTAKQLKFADSKAVVKEVGFYHGGDELTSFTTALISANFNFLAVSGLILPFFEK